MKAIAVVPGTKAVQLSGKRCLVAGLAHHAADLITHRHAYAEFDAAFQHHGADEIKSCSRGGLMDVELDATIFEHVPVR